jgi:hypothetical protein
LTLVLSDGTTETREIFCGSSYYSQSSATCAFGYPENNPPRKVFVRWPTGQKSEHVIESGDTTVTVENR